MKILEGLMIWAEYGLDEVEKCEDFLNVGGASGFEEFEEFEDLGDWTQRV